MEYDDDRLITICADRVEVDDSFEFDIEFESIPKPSRITWIMQDQEGRRETVYENEVRGNYEAFRIVEDVS